MYHRWLAFWASKGAARAVGPKCGPLLAFGVRAGMSRAMGAVYGPLLMFEGERGGKGGATRVWPI